MSDDLDKLKNAAEQFLAQDPPMLIKLVQKYPVSARLRLNNGTSLLAMALEDPTSHWPLLSAYTVGGGKFDGPSPTIGSSKCWIEYLKAASFQESMMGLSFLKLQGITGEMAPGVKLVEFLKCDLDDPAAIVERAKGKGLFAVGVEMGMRECSGENQLLTTLVRSSLKLPVETLQELIRLAQRAGNELSSPEIGWSPIHLAIGSRYTDLVIALCREGLDLSDYIETIRKNQFRNEDLARVEHEFLSIGARTVLDRDPTETGIPEGLSRIPRKQLM